MNEPTRLELAMGRLAAIVHVRDEDFSVKDLLDAATAALDAYQAEHVGSPLGSSSSSPSHSPSISNSYPLLQDTSLGKDSLSNACAREAERDTVERLWKTFCDTYPRRRPQNNAPLAKKKFTKLSVSQMKDCVTGAGIYKAHCDRAQKTGTEFVCMMTTFINQQRWAELIENEADLTGQKTLAQQAMELAR